MTHGLTQLRDALRKFAEERDWDQYHSPKNLASALAVEADDDDHVPFVLDRGLEVVQDAASLAHAARRDDDRGIGRGVDGL